MIKLLVLLFSFIPVVAVAEDSPKVKTLETQVQNLTARVEAMEAHFREIKKGGFNLVAVKNCELKTPYDGNYTATELSNAAAIAVIVDTCMKKAKNKNECNADRVVCK